MQVDVVVVLVRADSSYARSRGNGPDMNINVCKYERACAEEESRGSEPLFQRNEVADRLIGRFDS